MIYSSELDRGFDILELQPTDQLSKNEIEAAKLVKFGAIAPLRIDSRLVVLGADWVSRCFQ